MQVKDIVASKQSSGGPLGVSSDSKIKEAVDIMVKHDTGSCVVTDAKGSLVGMLTFREVLAKLAADPAACMETEAGAVMDKDPHVATPDDTVDQIRQVMTQHHIRYLPVMAEGKLTDVISFYDVARAVAKQTDFENRMLRNYISDWPEEET